MPKNYIKGKYLIILAFAFLIGIFFLIAELYNMPKDGYIYAIILCVFFGSVFMGYDFFKYSQKLRNLKESRLKLEFETKNMPKISDGIEAEYQKTIIGLYQRNIEILSKNDSNMTDMMDYYTLWAHQIKTPIAAARLLLQRENYFESKAAITMELFKIEQYVEMVLQYLRLDSDMTDFIIKQQNLNNIIKNAVKKYSMTFINKKIILEYEPINTLIVSDEKWLTFVIEQILSNSLKYTSKGKISIYLDKETEKTLVIEDTGIGIQKEDLPRICEKGYTGYNGRIDRKSTGIGLYLCQKILKKFGHTLIVESEVGVGTKVKIGLAYKFVRFE